MIKTENDFIMMLNQNKIKVIFGEYKNQYSMFHLEDNDGYRYVTNLYNYRISGLGRKFSKTNEYAIYNIKKYITIHEFNMLLLSDIYEGSYKKMRFLCLGCGKIFYQTLNYITRNNKFRGKCASCVKNDTFNNQKTQNTLDYIKNLGYEIIVGEQGSHTKVIVKDEYGYLYETTYNRLYFNRKPMITYNGNIFNDYNITNWLKNNGFFGKVTHLKSYYKNENIICKVGCSCGTIFDVPFIEMKNRGRVQCKKCSKYQSNISFLTEIWLNNNRMHYIKEYRFEGCKNKKSLPFDYAIFKDGILFCLIEVDGGQHYYPMYSRFSKKEEALAHLEYTKVNDDIKNKFCKNNNIKLIRLPFWYFVNGKYKDVLIKELI